GQPPLLGDRAAPEARAGQRELLLRELAEIDRNLAAALEGDHGQAAVRRQRREIALHIIAAYHVEHDIDAAAAGHLVDDGDEILLAIENRAPRAERLAGDALSLRADGDEHFGAARMRELDRMGADTARAAMHEQLLAFLQAAELEDIE